MSEDDLQQITALEAQERRLSVVNRPRTTPLSLR